MLTLPIKRRWFNLILEQDEKKRKFDEYRSFNGYWGKRFATALNFKNKEELDEHIRKYGKTELFYVKYRNGYSAQSPYIIAIVSLSIGTGKKEWGALQQERYYVQHIYDIWEVRLRSADRQ